MATTGQLNTKILLLNGSQTEWASEVAKSYVLRKGEPAIEFIPDAGTESTTLTAVKVKVGDGFTAYKDLPYVGDEVKAEFSTKFDEINAAIKSSGNAVFQIDGEDLETVEGSTEAEKIKNYITEAVNEGNVAIVKKSIVDGKDSYTAYVYHNGVWTAMDGNYSADNIYFDEDMMVTTNIGYITTTDGSGTIPSAGKSLTEVFEAMFVKEMEPDNNTAPSVSFASVTSGSNEVGTEVTPSYDANFNVGSYEYGPATGITLAPTDTSDTGWTVTAKNGTATVATKYTETGTFDKIIVDDSTSYTITAVANHTAGSTPKTNKGEDSTKTPAFTAGTKSKTSSAISGYRSYFYGAVKKDPSELTSADIRALTNGGNYNGSKSIEIKANGATDVKAFVIAIVGTNTRSGVTHVDSTAGMTVDVTGQYSLSTTIKPMVADKRGTNEDGTLNNGKEYKLWVWQPSEVDSGAVHKITLG